jgi:hypothetical protein
MKQFIFILAICIGFQSLAHAQKRKRSSRKPIPAVRFESGFYTYKRGGVRMIGNVYEITLRTYYPNVIFDSVWFGATPVPCDVYEATTGVKADTAKKPGLYVVKANRDLYRFFSEKIDSTQAARTFKAPYAFSSEAYVMYLYKGKRYFLPISGFEERKDKPLRQ